MTETATATQSGVEILREQLRQIAELAGINCESSPSKEELGDAVKLCDALVAPRGMTVHVESFERWDSPYDDYCRYDGDWDEEYAKTLSRERVKVYDGRFVIIAPQSANIAAVKKVISPSFHAMSLIPIVLSEMKVSTLQFGFTVEGRLAMSACDGVGLNRRSRDELMELINKEEQSVGDHVYDHYWDMLTEDSRRAIRYYRHCIENIDAGLPWYYDEIEWRSNDAVEHHTRLRRLIEMDYEENKKLLEQLRAIGRKS